MNYEECMEYLDNINRSNGMVMGIEPMRELLSQLGNPENNIKNIHVAGTNGKGSVSTFIAYILSEMGYRVGRYISPTVDGYTERIQKLSAGKKKYISSEEVSKYISIIKEVSQHCMTDDRQLTQFEIETAMAYMAFSDWKCDYVVLECGLGGIEDATNAVDNKEMCVFTTISKDHTAILGNTLTDITENKAGILREGVKAVSAIQLPEVSKTLEEKAGENNTKIKYCDIPYNLSYSVNGTEFEIHGEKYFVNLPGTYQPQNASLAVTAVCYLFDNIHIERSLISDALKKAVWPRRFEIIANKPYILVDGAHNVNGIEALASSIDNIFPKSIYKRIGVMGVFADKDVDGMIKQIVGIFDEMHTVKAPGPRGMNANMLADKFCRIIGMDAICHTDMSAKQVAEHIISDDNNNENLVVVIFGSLSLYCVE